MNAIASIAAAPGCLIISRLAFLPSIIGCIHLIGQFFRHRFFFFLKLLSHAV